jgi:hypothetical protein
MSKGRFDEKAGCTKKLPLLHWKEKDQRFKNNKNFLSLRILLFKDDFL